MARRLAALMCLCLTTLFLTGPAARADDAATRARPVNVQTSIRGATQMFAAPWGLVAQGSGQLRILPLGTSKWQTVHAVTGASLYRIAFDDAGRLLAWWEKEPHFHLFVPGTKAHETFPLPPPPSPEFKYGYGVEDMYFTKDGDGAIVYMHGFIGGRTWVTVAYHYDLARRTAPTLLFRQPGHVLHKSSRVAVHAIPKKPDDACEHNFCHPLGAVIAWEISGTTATKRVLLDGNARKEDLSRVQPVWTSGGDGEQVAVLVDEHPRKRHLLRWRRGDASATFAPLPPGPGPLVRRRDHVAHGLGRRGRGLVDRRARPRDPPPSPERKDEGVVARPAAPPHAARPPAVQHRGRHGARQRRSLPSLGRVPRPRSRWTARPAASTCARPSSARPRSPAGSSTYALPKASGSASTRARPST